MTDADLFGLPSRENDAHERILEYRSQSAAPSSFAKTTWLVTREHCNAIEGAAQFEGHWNSIAFVLATNFINIDFVKLAGCRLSDFDQPLAGYGIHEYDLSALAMPMKRAAAALAEPLVFGNWRRILSASEPYGLLTPGKSATTDQPIDDERDSPQDEVFRLYDELDELLAQQQQRPDDAALKIAAEATHRKLRDAQRSAAVNMRRRAKEMLPLPLNAADLLSQVDALLDQTASDADPTI